MAFDGRDYLIPLKDDSGKELLPCRVIPSPMEGVMTDLFCRAMSELKLTDCWITPFIRISNSVPGVKTLREKISRFTESKIPVTVQIMGNDPSFMAGTAKELSSLGINGININFACPSNTVIKNNSGGSLLKNVPLMKDIINAVKDGAGEVPVSVKLRAGFSAADEMPEILDAVRDSSPSYVIFHFRTAAEEYDDIPAGFERTAKAVEILGEIPLIASGDIFSVEDAADVVSRTGSAGVAAGRGLLRNPFLIREIMEFFKDGGNIDKKAHEEKALSFFLKTLEIARSNPARYWRRSSALESVRNLFGGADHPVFKKLLGMSDAEILALTADRA